MFFENEFEFLSNFAQCPMMVILPDYRKIQVATLEHAYQAAKAVTWYSAQYICEASTPGNAKRRGREIQMSGRARVDWDQVKTDIMRNLLWEKFHRKEFALKLLMTGDMPIIEHNKWHDNFWGSCLCGLCNDHGQNNLGRLIQRIRYDLLEAERG